MKRVPSLIVVPAALFALACSSARPVNITVANEMMLSRVFAGNGAISSPSQVLLQSSGDALGSSRGSGLGNDTNSTPPPPVPEMEVTPADADADPIEEKPAAPASANETKNTPVQPTPGELPLQPPPSAQLPPVAQPKPPMDPKRIPTLEFDQDDEQIPTIEIESRPPPTVDPEPPRPPQSQPPVPQEDDLGAHLLDGLKQDAKAPQGRATFNRVAREVSDSAEWLGRRYSGLLQLLNPGH